MEWEIQLCARGILKTTQGTWGENPDIVGSRNIKKKNKLLVPAEAGTENVLLTKVQPIA